MEDLFPHCSIAKRETSVLTHSTLDNLEITDGVISNSPRGDTTYMHTVQHYKRDILQREPAGSVPHVI